MGDKERKSHVWKYFELDCYTDTNKAKCVFCKKEISRGGKSHTTSNMKKHLQIHHKIEMFLANKVKVEKEFSELIRPTPKDVQSN